MEEFRFLGDGHHVYNTGMHPQVGHPLRSSAPQAHFLYISAMVACRSFISLRKYQHRARELPQYVISLITIPNIL